MKESKLFGFTAGDGKGVYQGTDSKPVKSFEFHDGLYHSEHTGDYTGVQYKYTNKAENVEPMIENHINKWRNKPEVVKPKKNVPKNLQFENIEIGMPPDVTHGQKVEYSIHDPETGTHQQCYKEPVSHIEVDNVMVELPSVADVENFVESNFETLASMGKDVPFVKDQQGKVDSLKADIKTKKPLGIN